MDSLSFFLVYPLALSNPTAPRPKPSTNLSRHSSEPLYSPLALCTSLLLSLSPSPSRRPRMLRRSHTTCRIAPLAFRPNSLPLTRARPVDRRMGAIHLGCSGIPRPPFFPPSSRHSSRSQVILFPPLSSPGPRAGRGLLRCILYFPRSTLHLVIPFRDTPLVMSLPPFRRRQCAPPRVIP